jgi:hypothetical protein
VIGDIAILVWLFLASEAWVLVPIFLLSAALAWHFKAKQTAKVLLIAALAEWLQRAILASLGG